MGYYSIRVNTDQLENCAKQMDNFVDTYDRKMRDISAGISDASAYWQGEEYNLFCQEWRGMEQSGSVSGKARQAIKNYAEYLRYAKELYQAAQQNAVRKSREL